MRSLRSALALTVAVALGLVVAAVASAASTNKNLVLIQGTKADNFYVTMGCGAQAEAKKLGYNISVQGPASFAAPQQIPIVQSVTATKPAAVMIAPTDEKALIAPMQAMKSAGIKVIQVDTTVSQHVDGERVDLVRQPAGRQARRRLPGEVARQEGRLGRRHERTAGRLHDRGVGSPGSSRRSRSSRTSSC